MAAWVQPSAIVCPLRTVAKMMFLRSFEEALEMRRSRPPGEESLPSLLSFSWAMATSPRPGGPRGPDRGGELRPASTFLLAVRDSTKSAAKLERVPFCARNLDGSCRIRSAGSSTLPGLRLETGAKPSDGVEQMRPDSAGPSTRSRRPEVGTPWRTHTRPASNSRVDQE